MVWVMLFVVFVEKYEVFDEFEFKVFIDLIDVGCVKFNCFVYVVFLCDVYLMCSELLFMLFCWFCEVGIEVGVIVMKMEIVGGVFIFFVVDVLV